MTKHYVKIPIWAIINGIEADSEEEVENIIRQKYEGKSFMEVISLIKENEVLGIDDTAFENLQIVKDMTELVNKLLE